MGKVALILENVEFWMVGGATTVVQHPWPALFVDAKSIGNDVILTCKVRSGEARRGETELVIVRVGKGAPLPAFPHLRIRTDNGEIEGWAVLTRTYRTDGGPETDEVEELRSQSPLSLPPAKGYTVEAGGWDEAEFGAGPGKARGKRGPTSKYPFDAMQAGERFRIAKGDKQPKLNTVQVMCSKRGRTLGRKFRCGLAQDGSIVVWRES